MPSNHTRGTWMRGRTSDSIVTDAPIETGSKLDPRSVEYYGGHVVAESISSNDVPLLLNAPGMYDALQAFVAYGRRECQVLPSDATLRRKEQKARIDQLADAFILAKQVLARVDGPLPPVMPDAVIVADPSKCPHDPAKCCGHGGRCGDPTGMHDDSRCCAVPF
jgi:hypothetical protein